MYLLIMLASAPHVSERPWFARYPQNVPTHLDYPAEPLFWLLESAAERGQLRQAWETARGAGSGVDFDRTFPPGYFGHRAAFSAKVFGGYDWWIGPQWTLGLAAVLSATPSSSLVVDDGDKSGYRFQTLSAGIAGSLTLH